MSAAQGAHVEVPTSTVDETIRRTVRALRSAHEVDAKIVAVRLGISRASLYNRLNGAAPFLAAEIAMLAAFFGVPITDFYEGIVRIGQGPATDIDTQQYLPGSSNGVRHLALVTDPGPGYGQTIPGYGSSGPENTYTEDSSVAPSAELVNNANAA